MYISFWASFQAKVPDVSVWVSFTVDASHQHFKQPHTHTHMFTNREKDDIRSKKIKAATARKPHHYTILPANPFNNCACEMCLLPRSSFIPSLFAVLNSLNWFLCSRVSCYFCILFGVLSALSAGFKPMLSFLYGLAFNVFSLNKISFQSICIFQVVLPFRSKFHLHTCSQVNCRLFDRTNSKLTRVDSLSKSEFVSDYLLQWKRDTEKKSMNACKSRHNLKCNHHYVYIA